MPNLYCIYTYIYTTDPRRQVAGLRHNSRQYIYVDIYINPFLLPLPECGTVFHSW